MSDKVVLTGGSGFLGSFVADNLTEKGYEVTIFDQKPSPWIKKGQQMVVGDILDEKVVRQCVEGSRYVVHMAGIADIGQASVSPLETVRCNVLGTSIILDASVWAGIERFVFASTVYVYSQHGSFYRASKQSAETLIETYNDKFGLEYTILRYGSLYGPRSQEWNGLRRYIIEALRHGRIRYRGTGEERREYIHVQDAARMTVETLTSEYANCCLTITGTQVLSSKELVQMIQEIVGKGIDIEFSSQSRDYDHYILTPYRYTPKQAKKMVPKMFIDIGQGILDLVDEVNQGLNPDDNCV